ncbi:MAG: DUF3789 domain-containing protein [Clostridia bacterium]|nr:DUF3789 domain-containing protein [Clostridia bacterium]
MLKIIIAFIAGMMLGGTLGVFAMCLFTVPQKEEKASEQHTAENTKGI